MYHINYDGLYCEVRERKIFWELIFVFTFFIDLADFSVLLLTVTACKIELLYAIKYKSISLWRILKNKIIFLKNFFLSDV